MGNLPVVHEVTTSFRSLGDAVTGNPQGARDRWHIYAEESFFGSGIYAAVEASKGNLDRANQLGKGMGRATGKILCGGGLLRDAPVFHELATCGDSLGDMIGGGDHASARLRWDCYAEGSVVGSGIYSIVETQRGQLAHARALNQACGKASAKAGITLVATAATVGTTIATMGAGAPVAIAVGATVGATAGGAATVGVQAVDGNVNPGDVVGNALLGGTAGAIAGGVVGRAGASAGASTAAEAEAVGLSRAGTLSTAVRVSAASAATVAGLGNERLVEVRRRIWERRGSVCEPTQGLGEKSEEQEDEWDTLKDELVDLGLDAEQPLECAICLEDALTVPGIARVHYCGKGCSDDGEGCCRHAFHRSCIEEWRRACEAQSEEFTCPECRRVLRASDVEAMPPDPWM